jgi:hypothetical protein
MMSVYIHKFAFAASKSEEKQMELNSHKLCGEAEVMLVNSSLILYISLSATCSDDRDFGSGRGSSCSSLNSGC